jgi:hypothetical protein
MRGERDLPPGHPSASDYVPGSPAAERYKKSVAQTLTSFAYPADHPAHLGHPNPTPPYDPRLVARDYSRPETVRAPAEQPRDPANEEEI